MDDAPTPDDTLPDEATFDTIADFDALEIEGTYPQFPVPRPKAGRTKRPDASPE